MNIMFFFSQSVVLVDADVAVYVKFFKLGSLIAFVPVGRLSLSAGAKGYF